MKNMVSVSKPKSNVSSLAEILQDFIEVEDKKYNDFQYNHNPTLGAMYEALTENVVGRMLPPNLGLSIVSGFIYDDKGYRSGEIDRMLVMGGGKQLGLTDKYEYHIKDILVVFEVKKTLDKAAFIDAYQHLAGISKAYSHHFEALLENGYEPNIEYAAKSFAQITGLEEPNRYADIHKMKKEDALIFYTLVQDTYAPVKIIHGYGGYKTESGLRNVFLDFLEERQRGHGFGTPSMPNLISSENYSIVKATGMPFKSPRFENGYWPIIVSSRDNIVHLIIELIWTKISIFCDVSMPWGDDMDAEVMVALLSGRYVFDPTSGEEGWLYSATEIKESELKSIERQVDWEPVIAPMVVKEVAQTIGLYGGVQTDSDTFNFYMDKWNFTGKDLIDQLLGTNLFSIGSSGWITFIGNSLHLVEVDGDKCAVSDNAQRLRKWCEVNSVTPTLINFINVDKL
ncbi:DUF6602 domain-containing protein [Neptunomonas sp. XY-337]|uniref:DUF6602 domain-containing protein n=1 Tax=Neptunomonas sp. XY-337 TaxID=2561897 RepID=UPI0010AACB1B|nr:DUF6602 domain-containing protein [Neptunomonas sp. XY-337]